MTPFRMLLTMWRKKRSSAVGAGRTFARRSGRIAGAGEAAGRRLRARDGSLGHVGYHREHLSSGHYWANGVPDRPSRQIPESRTNSVG